MRRPNPTRLDHLELEHLEPRSLLDGVLPSAAELLFQAAHGLGVKDARIIDVTDDGMKDAVIIGEDRVVVRPYNGDGGFLSARTTLLPANPARFASMRPQFIHTGDFDGDGVTDLVLSAVLTGIHGVVYQRTWILSGDGTGAFAITTTIKGITPLLGYFGPRAIDMDGDGRDELINYTGRAYGFAGSSVVNKGIVSPELARGTLIDFDEDGDTDAVGLRRIFQSGGGSTTSLMLARNNGTAGFSSETILELPFMSVTGFSLGDITGDGQRDLLIFTVSYTTSVQLELSVFAAKRDGGTFTIDPTPIYIETAESVRVRGGHSPGIPEWPYNYSASVTSASTATDLGGDSRTDISFGIVSDQSWGYRPGGNEDIFNETFPVELIATGTVRPSGVPNYTSRDGPAPTHPYQPPYQSFTIASGDIDGDGIDDHIVQRGDAGRGYGQRLAYAQLSSARQPAAQITALYKNGVGTSAIQLAEGDRLRVVLRVDPGAADQTLAPARMFIDSNNNGRWDAGDALLRIGIEQPQLATGLKKFYSFNVIRRTAWAGPGAVGVRALFFVPFDSEGNSGVPATWMVNLI